MRLNVMQRIKDNHAWRNRYLVFDQLAAIAVTTKYFECCVGHNVG